MADRPSYRHRAVRAHHSLPSSGQTFVPPSGLTLSHLLLLSTSGTLTELLEACVGEPITIARLSEQRITLSRPDMELDVPSGAEVLDRRVLLCRTSDRRPLVYAASTISCDRLPAALLTELLTTTVPLGRLLVSQGVPTLRRPVGIWTETAGELVDCFGLRSRQEPLLCRAFTLTIAAGASPAMRITEKLPSLDGYVGSAARARAPRGG